MSDLHTRNDGYQFNVTHLPCLQHAILHRIHNMLKILTTCFSVSHQTYDKLFVFCVEETMSEQERLKKLVHDTVSMLCRNSVAYERALRIEGLIGITVDDNDVFLIHINDTIGESRDAVSHDTGYCQNVKSEHGYTEDIGESRPKSMMMMRTYQMPYTHTSSTAAGAGNERVSSTVVTESVVIKTDDMTEEDGQWGAACQDSYSGLAYPSMDTSSYMSSAGSFHQQPSVVQHASIPRMPVCLCFIIRFACFKLFAIIVLLEYSL